MWVLTVPWGLASSAAWAGDPLPSYVQIDGRYYPAGASSWEYYPDVRAVAITDADLGHCTRAGGGAITEGSFAFYYGPSVKLLPVVLPVGLKLGYYRIAVFTTVHGDAVCSGEVPAPPAPPAPPEPLDPALIVFGDSFEV